MPRATGAQIESDPESLAQHYLSGPSHVHAPIFKGILNVLTTPFTEAGRIDFDILGQHIEFLLANGVHAIVSGGTTGNAGEFAATE